MSTKGTNKKTSDGEFDQDSLFGAPIPTPPKKGRAKRSTKSKQLKDGSVQLAFGFDLEPLIEAMDEPQLELKPDTKITASAPEVEPQLEAPSAHRGKSKGKSKPKAQPKSDMRLEITPSAKPTPQVELSEPTPQVELSEAPLALAVIPLESTLSPIISDEIEVEWLDDDELDTIKAEEAPRPAERLKRLSPELVADEDVRPHERAAHDSTPPPSEYEIALVAERVERLFEEAQRYADASRSPQTKRAYQSDWRDFSEWCVEHHLHPLPCAPEYIALYLTDRASTLKISTLRRRLTAIRQVHKLRGHQLDTKHAAIQSVWGGIRREKGSMEQGKDPLRVDLLRLIMLTRPRTLKGLRDRALIMLGFTGAFRRSELVSLNRGDLEFLPQGLRVTLRKSKTDQEGQGMLKSILPGKYEETCCIRALQTWLQASQIQSGPIFRPINRHEQLRARRLTSHAVAVILKDSIRDALRAQGIPEHLIDERVASFSGHSLRAGYVTSAAAEGAEEHAIMRQTGHKRIDTLRRYIREGDLFRHNPLKSMDL